MSAHTKLLRRTLFAVVVGAAATTVVFGAVAAVNGLGGKSDVGEVDTDRGQTEILSDSKVTFDEYRNTLMLAIECARDEGVSVSDPEVGADGVTLDYSVYEGDAGEATITVFDNCYNRLAHAVDLAFQTSDEVNVARQVYVDTMISCVYGSEEKAIEANGDLSSVIYPAERPTALFLECRSRTTDPGSIVATVSPDFLGAE